MLFSSFFFLAKLVKRFNLLRLNFIFTAARILIKTTCLLALNTFSPCCLPQPWSADIISSSIFTTGSLIHCAAAESVCVKHLWRLPQVISKDKKKNNNKKRNIKRTVRDLGSICSESSSDKQRQIKTAQRPQIVNFDKSCRFYHVGEKNGAATR